MKPNRGTSEHLARHRMQALRYPDFICLGAQKAATTWLSNQLGKHRDIWVPPVKELHYFDNINLPRRKNGDVKPTPMEQNRQNSALKGIQAVSSTQKKSGIPKLGRTYCLSLIGMRTLTDEWYGSIFEMARARPVCGELTP